MGGVIGVMKKVAAAAAFVLFSAPAIAGGDQTGYITSLIVRSDDGLVYVILNGDASGKPACARYSYWMIKDENSATGMRQLALLMLAHSKKRLVHISGTGTCSRWFDGEDIDGIQVFDTTAN